MKHSQIVLGLVCAGLAMAPALRAQAAPAAAPAAAPGYGLNISGLVDGYANYTKNDPATRSLAYRNFDVRTNGFSLNMARMAIAHDADPIGFRVDLGIGRAWDLFNFQDTANGFDNMKYLPQAYVSFKPASWKGVQVDFGKFYTSAGAELTETHLGWNYSRALMYANGPYYHFGFRSTVPVGKSLVVGAQLVNGWNNVEDTNTGKTVGLTSLYTAGGGKFTWGNNYYVGPEKANSNDGYRHFYDTVFAVNTSKVSAYLNIDYGVDKFATGRGSNQWFAVGSAAKFQLTKKFAISPRAEIYKDYDGFITGTPQNLKEFTLTGEYKPHDNFLTRLEYRRDWSDKAVFEKGKLASITKNQDTLALGLVFFFDNFKMNLGR